MGKLVEMQGRKAEDLRHGECYGSRLPHLQTFGDLKDLDAYMIYIYSQKRQPHISGN